MSANIAVSIEIRSEKVRDELANIISAVDGCTVLSPDVAGQLPEVLVIELDPNDPNVTFSKVASIAQSMPSTAVVLTAAQIDQHILLEAMRSGIKEFVVQPFQPEEVRKALGRLAAQVASSGGVLRSGSEGTVTAIIGGKAGVGTTTATVNLATQVRLLGPEKSVAVFDLNLRCGDLPVFLDLSPTRTLQDVDLDLTRLDDSFLSAILTRHNSGLYVMPLGEMELSGGYVTSECVDQTLKLMRSMFDHVFVDCGHVLDMATQTAIKAAKNTLVLSTVSVPAVQRTKRLLDHVRMAVEGEEKNSVDLVMNKLTAKEEEVLDDLAAMLGTKPRWALPADFELASLAINEGQPLSLIAPKKPLARSYSDMAASLIGLEVQAKTSLFGGLVKSVSGRFAKGGTNPELAS